ncbi:MAG: hypothetical protein NTY12_01345 [Candidatus Falkowbacteria bacterium]|nr:hypothetical protein [Candidatus Falkowbacteria bacterium]
MGFNEFENLSKTENLNNSFSFPTEKHNEFYNNLTTENKATIAELAVKNSRVVEMLEK